MVSEAQRVVDTFEGVYLFKIGVYNNLQLHNQLIFITFCFIHLRFCPSRQTQPCVGLAVSSRNPTQGGRECRFTPFGLTRPTLRRAYSGSRIV